MAAAPLHLPACREPPLSRPTQPPAPASWGGVVATGAPRGPEPVRLALSAAGGRMQPRQHMCPHGLHLTAPRLDTLLTVYTKP